MKNQISIIFFCPLHWQPTCNSAGSACSAEAIARLATVIPKIIRAQVTQFQRPGGGLDCHQHFICLKYFTRIFEPGHLKSNKSNEINT